LKTATLSREKEPPVNREIKTKNRLYLIITLGFIFMLTNAHIIQETLWNGLRKLVQWFSDIQSSPDGELVEDSPPSPAQDPQLPFDDKESGAIAKVLENIVMYAMYILLVLGAMILILLIIKKTRKKMASMFRAFIHFLKQLAIKKDKQEDQSIYIDEKENLFSWKEWKAERKRKAAGF